MMPREQAEAFVRKARLAQDAETTDAIWGLHAQQAVEKLLKAILVYRGLHAPFTHRLLDLADLLTDAGHHLPEVYEDLLDLTPYAVEFRYSALPEEHQDHLDRAMILAATLAFRQFVTDSLRLNA